MVDFEFSKHAIEQGKLRGIPIDLVKAVLYKPDTIIEEIDGQKIYQSIIQRDSKDYLLRIFVNSNKNPNLVKTVYMTSKIRKY